MNNIVQVWEGEGCRRAEVERIEGENLVLKSGGVVSLRDTTRAYTHISPTALSLYESDKSEFTMKYLTRVRAPRIPQTKPMAIGSAFDAAVKEAIREKLGYPIVGDLWSSVEPQWKEYGRSVGPAILAAYAASGALADLMLDINGQSVRYELDLKGVTPHSGVPIQGKPDLAYGDRILDWKVNGFLARAAPSPKPGYVLDRSTGRSHKSAQVIGGVNVAGNCDKVWHDQLRTYGWLLDMWKFMGKIEQLVGPDVRCVSYCWQIGEDGALEARYKHCYDYITGYTGDKELERRAATLWPTGDDMRDWFFRETR